MDVHLNLGALAKNFCKCSLLFPCLHGCSATISCSINEQQQVIIDHAEKMRKDYMDCMIFTEDANMIRDKRMMQPTFLLWSPLKLKAFSLDEFANARVAGRHWEQNSSIVQSLWQSIDVIHSEATELPDSPQQWWCSKMIPKRWLLRQWALARHASSPCRPRARVQWVPSPATRFLSDKLWRGRFAQWFGWSPHYWWIKPPLNHH